MLSRNSTPAHGEPDSAAHDPCHFTRCRCSARITKVPAAISRSARVPNVPAPVHQFPCVETIPADIQDEFMYTTLSSLNVHQQVAGRRTVQIVRCGGTTGRVGNDAHESSRYRQSLIELQSLCWLPRAGQWDGQNLTEERNRRLPVHKEIQQGQRK